MKDYCIERKLQDLISSIAGKGEVYIEEIAQSGSDRRYFRMKAGDRSYVGTFVQDPSEGECFVMLARGLEAAGRCVPKVYAVSDDRTAYIQEDLGDSQLFKMLGTPEAYAYIKETLRRLVDLQKTPESYWRDNCQSKPFCRRQAMWDLNYFKYEYLKPKETVYDEDRLEDDFERLSEKLISISEEFQGFMMRDCQSRNVMVTDRGPIFIDFQGARKGPVLYDAVSFLWQARAGFDREVRSELLDFYCHEYCGGDVVRKEKMLADLDDIILFRTLQVLGAYGFRGLVQRKPHFLMSIPGALANLRNLTEKGGLDSYPELKRISLELTSSVKQNEACDDGRLTVEIVSFSYKKGYPEDFSGNGGGFMFDCRALHNPGRYSEYRSLTGRDEPVKAFLEIRGEVKTFLSSAWTITDSAIERYLARGFTHLQIGFGCTGGQHRSVYCAERTADHVKNLFPEVRIRLNHREHPIKQENE